MRCGSVPLNHYLIAMLKFQPCAYRKQITSQWDVSAQEIGDVLSSMI
jgi:hypothetical protein